MRGSGHDELAGGNEHFLVGESDGAAELESFVGSFEADNANGGGNDNIGAGMSGSGQHAFTTVVNGGKRLKILLAEAASEFRGELRSGDGDDLGMMAKDVATELLEVAASGEGHNFELIGEGFDDGESLAANGAGRTEDGETLHWQLAVGSQSFVARYSNPKMPA